MADATTPAGSTPLTDSRPVPRGVLPRGMQTWVMAGVAGSMLLIMFIVGRPEPSRRASPTAMAPTAAAPTADRLRDYQDRLRVMEARAARERQAAAAGPATVPDPPTTALGGAASTSDPIAEDRKRRAYESLFASNVVLSRRSGDQQPLGNGIVAQAAASGTRSSLAPPNLEDVANAVVQATARHSDGPTASPAPAGAAPAHSIVSAPIAEAPGKRQTPASTEPVTDAGPLHRLLEGTVIDTVLTNRLDGANASPVNCLVTNAIYSHSGQYVLIPAGSRVLGNTKAVQSVGDSRLAVAFHRLILPDGRTVTLDQFTGLNQVGDAALRDQVNHHYWSTFGAAAAIGVISGLGQYLGTAGIGGSSDRTIVIAGGFGNATSEATGQVMNQFLNRLPTITIREGHRVEVYVTSDLELPAYEERSARTSGARRQ